jgi:hypothetical protein
MSDNGWRSRDREMSGYRWCVSLGDGEYNKTTKLASTSWTKSRTPP